MNEPFWRLIRWLWGLSRNLTIAPGFRVVGENGVMDERFVPVDRDQLMMVSQSLWDAVPEGHLARWVIEIVDRLDLGPLLVAYPSHGRGGRRAYHPAMMLALLIYAYGTGTRSSRRIEAACRVDAAYRLISGGQVPDHATIARFRDTHAEAMAALFTRVLAVCVDLGLGGTELVAVDGTKMAADASRAQNRDRARLVVLRDQVEAILVDAATTDRDEDGADSGGGLSARATSAAGRRLGRIEAALARVGDAEAAGQKPRANVTDPESRLMRVQGGWVQGYNAQAVACADGLILAAAVTQDFNDVAQLAPMVTAATRNLAVVGAAPPEVIVADAGYWSEDNASAAPTGTTLLIAAGTVEDPAPDPVQDHMAAETARRQQIFAAEAAAKITMTQAADALGLRPARAYELRDRYRRHGPDGLAYRKRPNGSGRKPKAVSTATQARRDMAARLAHHDNARHYRRRGPTIETVFGDTKHNLGYRRFTRRGLAACAAEWNLIHLARNIALAHRRRRRNRPPPPGDTPNHPPTAARNHHTTPRQPRRPRPHHHPRP